MAGGLIGEMSGGLLVGELLDRGRLAHLARAAVGGLLFRLLLIGGLSLWSAGG